MSNGELRSDRNIDPLPFSITGRYPGKHIVYSEDEQRVIGVGDTLDEAWEQAEASGVKGRWHFGYGYPDNVDAFLG